MAKSVDFLMTKNADFQMAIDSDTPFFLCQTRNIGNTYQIDVVLGMRKRKRQTAPHLI
jgi:hypothetical protein